jgi:hypothetical protein
MIGKIVFISTLLLLSSSIGIYYYISADLSSEYDASKYDDL